MNRVLILIAVFILSVVMISCSGDDTGNFPNEHDDLNWSDKAQDTMNWDDAVEYCEKLGGRLPTISELRTLIQNCPATETGGECEVTDSCLSWDCLTDPCDGCEDDGSGKYSVFGDTVVLWSSSKPSDYTDGAWAVAFSNGKVNTIFKSTPRDMSTVCVRP